MARNITGGDDNITVVAPANVSSGGLVVVGGLFGTAITDAAAGANVALHLGGITTLPKLSGASTAFTQGANVHWDATNAQCTVSATSNVKVGVAAAAAVNAASTVSVRLNDSF